MVVLEIKPNGVSIHEARPSYFSLTWRVKDLN